LKLLQTNQAVSVALSMTLTIEVTLKAINFDDFTISKIFFIPQQ